MYFNVPPLLKCACIPCLLHRFIILSYSPWVCRLTMLPPVPVGWFYVVFGYCIVLLFVCSFVIHSVTECMGYVHLSRTSHKCCSILSSSGAERTAKALFVSVVITLFWQLCSNDCLNLGIDLCVSAFCRLLWTGFCWVLA